MKSLHAAILVFSLLSLSGQETQKENPLEIMSYMVGFTWIGESYTPKDTSQKPFYPEASYEWILGGKAIEYKMHYRFEDGSREHRFTGMYTWNPAKKKIVHYNKGKDDLWIEGVEKEIDDGVTQLDFTCYFANGRVIKFKDITKKLSENTYQVTSNMFRDGEWKEVQKMKYNKIES